MVDLCVSGGTILTIDDDREIIENGSVAIRGDTIEAVGSAEKIAEEYSPTRTVDADNHLVLPGLISSHAHVSDILIRGFQCNRDLYDWLYNVKIPGVAAMTVDDHEIASALYMLEAIQSGFTTIVENATGAGSGYDEDTVSAKMSVYDVSGARNIYAHAFSDKASSTEFKSFLQNRMRREPAVENVDPDESIVETDSAIRRTEAFIEEYHGTADGRQSVWPSPYITWGSSPDGLRRAYELAEKYDVMTTTHVAETTDQEAGTQSSVEYLNDAGYLGERTLLGHCVHVSDSDIRVLGSTDTKVAHNPLTNMALGSGFAPVSRMIQSGLTVGLGTDNTSASDTVNAFTDMRFAALVHNGHNRDAGNVTDEKALEMATIDNARAIGRESDLGSLEPGKKADLILVNREHAHMVPPTNHVSSLVRRGQGFEVDTVICNGNLIMEDRDVPGLTDAYPDLFDRASKASRNLFERTGIDELNDDWNSIARI